MCPKLAAMQAVRIPNDHYPSDVFYAFKMEKGFTRTVAIFFEVAKIDPDDIDAQL